MLFIILFTLLMLAGALNTIFRGGEKEGICKYDYEEDSET